MAFTESFSKLIELDKNLSIDKIINTLWNSTKTNEDFQYALLFLKDYADDQKIKIEQKAFQSIIDNKEHIEAGFTKEGTDYKIILNNGRSLFFDPFHKVYELEIDKEEKEFVKFKQQKPKAAIYFANNVL